MPSGITRHIFGSRRLGGTIVIPSEGELLSIGNKISVSPGACVCEGYADGAMDIQKGSVNFTGGVTTVFHFGHILRNHWYGSLMKIDYITLFFTANGTSTLQDFSFGYNALNPALGITLVLYADPAIYDDGDNPKQFGPINEILGEITETAVHDAREYALQITVNAGAAPNNLVMHGIEIEYSLVTGG